MNKLFIGFLILLVGCTISQEGGETREAIPRLEGADNFDEEMLMMKLKSSAFSQNGKIPSRFTCDGEDISPRLLISGVPNDALSLALIMDDPDAPRGTFVHWVAWNLPSSTKELPEGVLKESDVLGFKQGKNDFRSAGYGGPCPPSGVHRYFFKLYALDTLLDLPPPTTKADLEKAMQGHILAQAELMGTFTRQ